MLSWNTGKTNQGDLFGVDLIFSVLFIGMKITIPVDFEPKRNNRYVVEFPDEFDIPPYSIQSVTLPKLVNMNWEPIQLKFLDIIGPSTSNAIMTMVRKMKSEFDLGKTYEFHINGLDPIGSVIESWKIQYNTILYIDFGRYSYENDNLKCIDLTIQPTNCILQY